MTPFFDRSRTIASKATPNRASIFSETLQGDPRAAGAVKGARYPCRDGFGFHSDQSETSRDWQLRVGRRTFRPVSHGAALYADSRWRGERNQKFVTRSPQATPD